MKTRTKNIKILISVYLTCTIFLIGLLLFQFYFFYLIPNKFKNETCVEKDETVPFRKNVKTNLPNKFSRFRLRLPRSSKYYFCSKFFMLLITTICFCTVQDGIDFESQQFSPDNSATNPFKISNTTDNSFESSILVNSTTFTNDTKNVCVY